MVTRDRKYLTAWAVYTLVAVSLIASLASCGDDEITTDSDKQQIEACVARGGHAVFTQSESGRYVYYIACEEPTTP